MKIQLLIGVILVIRFSTQDQSLLCSHCNCTNTKENTVDVNCTDQFITYNVLYDKSTWVDEKDSPYPLGRVVLKLSDLPDLMDPFPFSNLTYLDLSKNYIRRINDSCFAQFQNMHTLILSDNEIDNLKPDVFKGLRMDGNNYPLRSLKVLKLDNNRLHTLNDDLFEHLEQVLEVLDLSYNPFKVLDLQTTIAIGSIIYLKELDLSYTGIKSIPDSFLHTPKHLKLLDLSGNSFTSVPQGLTDVHTLETLIFNANPIVNLTQENGFKNISTLKTLYFCNMFDLECIGARSISSLEQLSEIHICNNIKLSHIDPAAFSRVEAETEIWPPIKKLNLINNQLTSIDFHLLIHWNNLKELDLRYNPWTCECENQWMVETLMPIYLQINEDIAKQIKCEAPIEMVGLTFYDEYNGTKTMRCLDLYNNRPEQDGTILIGVLIGLLIGIPLVLLIIFAYQRNWFGVCENGPAAYSRKFYRRTRSDEL
ncbi:hypothetical protein RN001_010896 [Aquatica leii]|uniref:Toll-like receptor 3 n=1 Tax=Aquatica leii TaxID=1421715 RepID=A0AAN7Q3N9_9COLE|nr:hypothetical protein RN001_010896 [Aquatica leii]